MSWIEIAAIVMLLIGIGAGGFLVSQRPSFWAGLALIIIKSASPYVIRYVTKPMSPEEMQRFHDCVRRGGEWDHARKRCKQ